MQNTDPNIFICYSRGDSEFAIKLAKDLREQSISVWIDQLDVAAGERWDRVTEEALYKCKSVIVILSPESVASENVMDEIAYALDEGKKIIPVLYLECSVPFRIRRFQRIDFTGEYNEGFNSLVNTLNAEHLSIATKEEVKDILSSDEEQKEEERLEVERKQKEEERLEVERKQKEEERLEAERKQKEEERLEVERKQKEEERLEVERKQKEEERLKAERKKKKKEKAQLETDSKKREEAQLKVESRPFQAVSKVTKKLFKRKMVWATVAVILVICIMVLLILPLGFLNTTLESEIRDQIGKNFGIISEDDLKYLYALNVDLLGESQDISILQYCTNLRTLFISNGQIKDLSPLTSLTNLTELRLNNNEISDISSLDSLIKLEILYLRNNKIEDISALTNLANLDTVAVDGNLIKDIFPLMINPGILAEDVVDLSDNPLEVTSINDYIPILQEKGVDVLFGPSN